MMRYAGSAPAVAAVTMAAVLASYGSALVVEHAADLRVDVVVQAVILSWTAAWVQRAADTASRLLTLAVLPAATVGSVELAVLIHGHPNAGDAVFVACFFLAIWVRRFGRLATRAGTLAVLPLVATLVLVLQSPIVPPFQTRHTVWLGVVAVIAAVWSTLIGSVAVRLRLIEPAVPVTPPATPVPAAQTAADKAPPAGGAAIATSPGRPRPRVSAHTRIALQMAVSLGVTFPVARYLFAEHWAWAVLTAYIVGSGARARTDVLERGVLRAAGAAVGTVVAALIADRLGRGDDRSVVLIFVILTAATLLRSRGYAYWAGCVTALLSLLYGYFGQDAMALLGTRLAAILVGAAIGIAASWLVLPIRASGIVRRRTAEALSVLAALLDEPRWDTPVLPDHCRRFEAAVRQVGQAARPTARFRGLRRRWRSDPHYTDAAEIVERLRLPICATVQCAQARPDLKTQPGVAQLTAALLANVHSVRSVIGQRPGRAYAPAPAVRAQRQRSRLGAALADIDCGLAALNRVFAPPLNPPGQAAPQP